uniref:Uncharacterized protein n=1 Tax=Populus trichocarpa TaxID=3694 RepID=A0A3N7GM71_POPTR
MLMMFQLCQVMVMISFSSSITLLASDQLHPGEVEALTVNEDGQLSLKFVDSCQPDGFVKTELTSAPPNLEGNSTIGCNCSITDDNYCHITSFQLKDYSLPGKARFPPELAKLYLCPKNRFHSQLSIRHNSGGMGFDEKSVFHLAYCKSLVRKYSWTFGKFYCPHLLVWLESVIVLYL